MPINPPPTTTQSALYVLSTIIVIHFNGMEPACGSRRENKLPPAFIGTN
ncbi:MAG: hypothetical protein WBO34_14630 [Gammaproteobacteria bacterium]